MDMKEMHKPSSVNELVGKFIVFTDLELDITSMGKAISVVGENFLYLQRVLLPGTPRRAPAAFMLSIPYMAEFPGLVDIFDSEEDLIASCKGSEPANDDNSGGSEKVTSLHLRRKK